MATLENSLAWCKQIKYTYIYIHYALANVPQRKFLNLKYMKIFIVVLFAKVGVGGSRIDRQYVEITYHVLLCSIRRNTSDI